MKYTIKFDCNIRVNSPFSMVMENLKLLQKENSLVIGKKHHWRLRLDEENSSFTLREIAVPNSYNSSNYQEIYLGKVIDLGEIVEIQLGTEFEGLPIKIFFVPTLGSVTGIVLYELGWNAEGWLIFSIGIMAISFLLFGIIVAKIQFKQIEQYIKNGVER